MDQINGEIDLVPTVIFSSSCAPQHGPQKATSFWLRNHGLHAPQTLALPSRGNRDSFPKLLGIVGVDGLKHK